MVSFAEAGTISITEDRLLGGRVALRQPAEGYRAAIDPVLLAAAVRATAGDRVLDLGCGVGSAALCLLARVPDLRVTGLELQPRLAEIARENAVLNGVADRLHIEEGSVLAPPPTLAGQAFDHVMTNPPFLEGGKVRVPPMASKATANVEGEADLAAWIKAAVKFVKPKGRLVVIHRADRLGDLLAALEGRGVGEIRILPLWPKRGRPAGRVVVTARRAVRTPLDLLPGLVLHEDDGGYTAAAEAVLRGAEAL
jgi:tRNA1(Val) A37 N6-methylase TrmN6